MTNKWRVEGKEVFKSMHKNIHLNEIFNCLLQAFGQFQIDAREPIKETQFDKMVGCHGIFAALESFLVLFILFPLKFPRSFCCCCCCCLVALSFVLHII